MTREEIKKAAEIMLAFADGAEIQYSHKGQNNWLNWINESSPSFDWQTFDYRIKPEPKYRPFKTQEECWQEMLKHDEFGWVKSKTRDANKHISNIEKDIEGNVWFVAASFSGIEKYSPKQMLDYFVFMDGEPFGIKEE